MPVFQSERNGTNTAKSFSLVLLNGVLMLTTKGQSKQKAIIIVIYTMLWVPQSYAIAEMSLCCYQCACTAYTSKLLAQALNKLII